MDNLPTRPANDSWVAAVHRTEADDFSLGSAFVLDSHRVITCAHVVHSAADAGDPLWVAFPKAEESAPARILVQEILLPPPDLQRIQDAAVLRLSEPVPTALVPRLRCPVPTDMVNRDWWAFGFPGGEVLGNSAAGLIGEALGYGWVRLDTHSRYPVKSGFSGSALWSPEYDAVIGMVGQASGEGDARALSLWQIDRIFPAERIVDLTAWKVEAAGESALASWGWSLRDDPEAGRHWRPRARGVSIETEKGFRFRGRTAALNTITNWISSPPTRKALVITGSPGVGKSAVLGRIVTTADQEISDQLPVNDSAARAPIGSISCAVHAKGKTALDVATEIAAAASAAIPEDIEYLPERLREALEGRFAGQNSASQNAFTVIIDALDEASTAQQARLIIRRIITPLVETCTDLNIRVIVGSRRRDDSGDLLASFGRALTLIDLDHSEFFEQEDLRSYTVATLQMHGDERHDNPYLVDEIAEPVAQRIADMAARNFLVAGLVARTHGLHDQEPVHPDEIAFIPTVDGALYDYLDRIQPLYGHAAGSVLTALAYAEAPGFSLTLWCTAISALGGPAIPETALASFARSSAANFLVESSGEHGQELAYRLFHQALNDTLISARVELHSRIEDEMSLAHAMIAEGERTNWMGADPYLKRSLPGHAENGKVLDDLLTQAGYLLHADLRRLLPITDRTSSTLSRNTTKLLRRTPEAFNADPSRRLALFSVSEAQQRLGHTYRDFPFPAPYRALWSNVVPGREEAVLDGHTRWSYVLRAFSVEGQELLASAGGDRTVRIWDPVLGEVLHVMEGHTDEVRSIVPVRLGALDALASVGRDGAVRFWDPLSGDAIHQINGDPAGYSALCSFTRDGRTLLAAARAADSTIQMFDPLTGEQVSKLNGHDEWISDLCEVTFEGTTLLASCSEDGTVILQDPVMGVARWSVTHGNTWDGEWIRTMCTVVEGGRTLLIGGGYDSVIRIWDPRDGTEVMRLKGHEAPVLTICSTTIKGESVIASGSEDGTLRLWSPHTGNELTAWSGHAGAIYSVSAIHANGQTRLASTGDDRSIRIWDPNIRSQNSLTERGDTQSFDVACTVRTKTGLLMATSRVGANSIEIRDPTSWETIRQIRTENTYVLCVAPWGGESFLASAKVGIDIWDPCTGNRVQSLSHPRARYAEIESIFSFKFHSIPMIVASLGTSLHFWDVSRVQAVHAFDVPAGARQICAVPVRDRLAISGINFNGRRIEVWDPGSGKRLSRLESGRAALVSQCAVKVGSRVLLATGNEFGLIQFWDVTTQALVASLEGHSARVGQLWVSVVDGHTVLVSAGDDRMLRIWDPTTLQPLVDIPVHYTIEWAAQAGNSVTLSLDSGMLSIELDLCAQELAPDPLSRQRAFSHAKYR
ncbi:AAA family ATPase [Streptomyces sp. NE06-03C]|uniref:AAA family ATPase n=1 Tax=Streptomyces sp. NE06-03C TaxID=3028694 RepID=UPI0029A95877|nr:AAA family ATPase [Streptomyces sp. NE06-03C]MDX2917056.1 trypsin-like peptidase domain-containing protein [Streptomyces sp. NE06-03C]